jgi:hypothetical protein
MGGDSRSLNLKFLGLLQVHLKLFEGFEVRALYPWVETRSNWGIASITILKPRTQAKVKPAEFQLEPM